MKLGAVHSNMIILVPFACGYERAVIHAVSPAGAAARLLREDDTLGAWTILPEAKLEEGVLIGFYTLPEPKKRKWLWL